MRLQRREFLASSAAALALAGCTKAGTPDAAVPAEAPSTAPAGPHIEVFEDALAELIDAGSPVESLASGYTWSEGRSEEHNV